jgi:hypothetical protein
LHILLLPTCSQPLHDLVLRSFMGAANIIKINDIQKLRQAGGMGGGLLDVYQVYWQVAE